MIMWIAIIIIIILMYIDKDDAKSEKELGNQIVGYNTMNGRPILRKHVNITGYDTRTGQAIFEYKKPIIAYNSFTGDPIFEGEKIPEPPVPKQPMTEEDKTRLSNTILMITGAALVVIASIIFLATGWETMHGFLKTLILFAIQMIFCLFGHISNNKLNIPKIGKMFTYLTLAFVPIVLLSLSFFELVGDYFSIGCDGFTYYIGLSLIASDVVYKLYGKAKKELFVKRSSLVIEAIALIFIVSNFELMYIEIFAMILHTIITYMLLQGGFLDQEAYKGLNDFYSIFLIIVAGIPTLIEVNVMSFTNLLLLALSFFVRCLEAKDDSQKKPLLILFFISYLLSIRIIEQVEISPYFLYLLSLLPILGLTKIVNTETMKKNIVRVVGITTIAITAYALFDSEKTIYYLLTYVIGFVLSLLVYFLTNKSFYKLWSYITFSAIFFVICYITELDGVADYILLVMPILIYAIEIIYEKLKDITSPIFIIGCLIIEVLVFTETSFMIVPLLLMTVYLLLEKRHNLMLIPMILSFLLVSIENQTLVTATYIGLIILYLLLSIMKEKFNKYTLFSALLIFVLCIYLECSAYVLWSLILVWGIIHYIFKPKDNNEVYVSAMILSLFGLYTKALIDIDSELYANYALGIILVSIAMTKGVLKKADKILIAIIECLVIGLLTLVGSAIIQEPIDGVAYLGIMLILSILAYVKNWRFYLYSSIISMIFGTLVLTAEYWQEIPWYVYILVIGLALIIFAMFDEKRKQNKKLKEQSVTIPQVQENIDTQMLEETTLMKIPVDNQVVEEQPIVAEVVPVVAVAPVVEEPTPVVEEQNTEISNTNEMDIQIVEDTSTQKVCSVNKTEVDVQKTAAKKSNKTSAVHRQQKYNPKNRKNNANHRR